MFKQRTRAYGALTAALLLSACAVGDDYARPGTELPLQWPWQQTAAEKAAEQQQEQVKRIPRDWWKLFNDPALTALVDEGLQHNSDALIAAARVAQARAYLGVTNADLYPTIGVEGAARRTSNSEENTMSGFALNSKPYNNFTLGAVLNYELDLWGRLRRSSESARARLLASESNRDAIDLAVASDIASGYFNLLALDAQIAVTEDTIVSREEAYRYEDAQYRHGAVNELTYRQAESELASARAALPALVQARVEQESALAILLGRSPAAIIDGKVERTKDMSALPASPVLPDSLPSTLLERRPDIHAAEQNLVAANADIGVAKANYFPTLSLSALLGLASSEADDLLQSSARQWNAGASIAGPLLDFGRVAYGVDGARATKQEAELTYQQTVRAAFKQVLDSLSAEKTSAERLEALKVQTGALSETLRVAQLRYNAGYSNYLEVLDAQRNLYQAQLNGITAARDRLSASVNLYKALGGGWAADEKQKTTAAETPVAAPAVAPAEEAAPAEKAASAETPAETPAVKQEAETLDAVEEITDPETTAPASPAE